MIGIGMMPVSIPGFEDVMERVANYSDPDIEKLKLAKFIIEFSKEVEESRADAFGKTTCQIVRNLARAELMNVLEEIKGRIADEVK